MHSSGRGSHNEYILHASQDTVWIYMGVPPNSIGYETHLRIQKQVNFINKIVLAIDVEIAVAVLAGSPSQCIHQFNI